MVFIFFIPFFLIGGVMPFLFIKFKPKISIWIPAIVFLIATILIGIKASSFPAVEMGDLGERVYMMMLGVATLGSLIGGIIAKMFKKV